MIKIMSDTKIELGEFAFSSDVVVNKNTTKSSANSLAEKMVLKNHGLVNGYDLFNLPSGQFLSLKVTVNLRFKDNTLQEIGIVWLDGKVQKLGYEAEIKDLLLEKDTLSRLLAKRLNREPNDMTLGATYFQMPWGLIYVSADQKSSYCSVVIDYSWKETAKPQTEN